MPKDLRKEIYRSGMAYNDAAAASQRKELQDPMVKTFMQFLDDEEDEMVRVQEDFTAPAASGTNTPGMGNVSLPTGSTVGSGDRFDNGDEDEDNDDIMKSFRKFLKMTNMKGGKGKK
jgi:hypothetical protein